MQCGLPSVFLLIHNDLLFLPVRLNFIFQKTVQRNQNAGILYGNFFFWEGGGGGMVCI